MLRVLVRLSGLSERRASAAAVGVHRRPVASEVGVHRVLERLATRRAEAVFILLKGQREQAVDLGPRTERGDAEMIGTGGSQLSEDVGGLRVSETLREKSGTATFVRTSALARSTKDPHW